MTSSFKEKFEDTDSENSNIHESFREGSSFEDNNDEHHVLLFIKQTHEGDLEPQEDCLEILATNDRPISFICILGQNYKKYAKIANQFCQISDSGFLSQSVRGNEGVWIYTKPYFNARTNSIVYYILAKQSQQEPITPKILSFASLISGSIVYVTDGLNNNSLDMLRSVTELPEHIIFDSKNQSFELQQLMPSFNWIMTNKEKNPDIKKNVEQYLSTNSNSVKKSINSFFKKRETYSITDSQDQKKSTQIDLIKRKILINTSNKTLQDYSIDNGSIAAIMIERLTENINKKGVIPLDEVCNQINDIASKTAYHSAISHYVQMYDHNFGEGEPKGEELYDTLKQMRAQTIQEFDRNALKGQSDQERRNLLQFLQNHEVSIVQANSTVSQIHNLKILKQLKNKIQENQNNGKYHSKQILDQDIEKYIEDYNERARGPNKDTILSKFLSHFKGVFDRNLINNITEHRGGDFPQGNYGADSQRELVYTLGAPTVPTEQRNVRDLENKIQQLENQLQTKQLKNSLVIKKQLERVELQNQAIRNQMSKMNNVNQKPKTQKCCLLF